MTVIASDNLRIVSPFPGEHASQIVAWLQTPREAHFDDFGPFRALDINKALHERLRSEKTFALFEQGTLAGYCGCSVLSPMLGQFHGLVVAPESRRRGLGRRFLSLVIRDLQSQGIEKFLSMPYADNTAILPMLAGLGFVEHGVITGAARRKGQPLDVRVMGFPG